MQLDTNLVENDIRPFVIGRKNWLFSDYPEGTSASRVLFVNSVCQTLGNRSL
ncbi:IS66 family element, transposase domain protein [Leptospira mayottensis 200901122]|uniref:IS66 family element, transposase domain protein n=1 Tax=Leptospira mayottensis 200901122 TaxID=1193010 RepID=A0AA87MK93_9LEPT|nr:IS66 family element, transposase domain protein [Leptospira mayottensis 200901122]